MEISQAGYLRLRWESQVHNQAHRQEHSREPRAESIHSSQDKYLDSFVGGLFLDKLRDKYRDKFRDRSPAKFRDSPGSSLDRPSLEDCQGESRRASRQDSGLMRTASWYRSHRSNSRDNSNKEILRVYKDNQSGSSREERRIPTPR